METAKRQAQNVVRRLPDDCSFKDIQYELYVLEKIRKSKEAVARGEVVSHEEAKRRMARWLTDVPPDAAPDSGGG